jgi:predicted metal-dependent hydrolase
MLITTIQDFTSEIIHLDPDLNVKLNLNLRAKRITIRIKGNEVILTIPKKSEIKKGVEFLKSKASWIKSHLSKSIKIDFIHNETIKIFDKNYIITHSNEKTRGISLTNDKLIIYGKDSNFDIRIKKFLSLLLKKTVTEYAFKMSSKLNVSFNKISIKDMDSRWGSCSSRGNLSFSFKLIFSPESIIEYIVAHEVSHLREMNHSPRFWAHVESLYPNWKKARQLLKDSGKYIV